MAVSTVGMTAPLQSTMLIPPGFSVLGLYVEIGLGVAQTYRYCFQLSE